MGKAKQKIQLSPAQVTLANKLNIPVVEIAKHMASMTTFNPNEDPVYSIPLSELVNLWRARFGDTWVDVSELEEDFWVDASTRLHQNNMMEEINHRADTTPWARLKEDA